MNKSIKEVSHDSCEPFSGARVVTNFGTGFVSFCPVGSGFGLFKISLDGGAVMMLYRDQFRVIE